jgi:hypothetical protein
MILNIILLIIFFHLFLEKIKNGLIEGMSEKTEKAIDIEPPYLGIECDPNINIVYPWYDKTKNLYTNKKKYMAKQYENILEYARTSCE